MLSLHGQSRGQEGGQRITGKNCQPTHRVKNGFVCGKQRYQCRAWGYHVVLGEERHAHATEVQKALCMSLSSLGKASFGFLAKLVGVSRTTTYYWIRHAAASTDEPTMPPDILGRCIC
jgi:transposase-like protein